jgi:ubiquinone/menaquinone biosynthesis C-methylase UbiE
MPAARREGSSGAAQSRLARKLRKLRLRVSENGATWTVFNMLWRGCHWMSQRLDERMRSLEARYNLPGDYSVSKNYDISEHETRWESANEDWTPSQQWKEALIDEGIRQYARPAGTYVEIGPGAGRWSEALSTSAGRLLLVDISPKAIEICRRRLAGFPNVEFFVNDGTNLDFIPSDSVDFIFSVATFAHISPPDTDKYLAEFARVLRAEGCGVIQHSGNGGALGGWRSRMTSDLFATLLRSHGLTVVRRFDSWGANGQFKLGLGDVFTVFRKKVDARSAILP